MRRLALELLLGWKKSEKSSYLVHDMEIMKVNELYNIKRHINDSIFCSIMADEVGDNFWLQISINWFIPNLFIDSALTVHLVGTSTLNRGYSKNISFRIFCSIPSLLGDILIRLEILYVVSIQSFKNRHSSPYLQQPNLRHIQNNAWKMFLDFLINFY